MKHKLHLCLALALLCFCCSAFSLPDWTSWGGNPSNTRSTTNTNIRPHNADSLALAWTSVLDGDVSATPVVWNDFLFVPTFNGSIYKIKAKTGNVIWKKKISEFTGSSASLVRSSPAISPSGILVLGDQTSGKLMAIRASTGAMLWVTTLDSHPAASLTMSPAIDGNKVFVGVSSQEHTLAAFVEGYPCCSFAGSMTATNINTGALIWKTRMIPESLTGPGLYSGAAVWGSGPAFDDSRVCFGSGNPYAVPDNVTACEAARTSSPNPAQQPSCIDERVLFDSMLCANKRTGQILWSKRTEKYDAWTVGCILPMFPVTNCPEIVGPDADYPQGPIMIGNSVGQGQKSGVYWMRDKNSGQLQWATAVGPGSERGGMMWGSAYEQLKQKGPKKTTKGLIYVAIANGNFKNATLINNTTINYGFFAALDSANGTVLWQTPDPTQGGLSGPLTATNGVVFGGSMTGGMFALNGETGSVLWSFASGGSVASGPAVSGDWVFWGNGYTRMLGTPHTGLFAFKLRRKKINNRSVS